jgi:Domain of unknown function (DUF4160)
MVIVREGEWSLEIYTRDHPPPHVHARCPGGEAKVSIPPPGQPVTVLRAHNLAAHQALRAVRLVEACIEELRTAWSEIHD